MNKANVISEANRISQERDQVRKAISEMAEAIKDSNRDMLTNGTSVTSSSVMYDMQMDYLRHAYRKAAAEGLEAVKKPENPIHGDLWLDMANGEMNIFNSAVGWIVQVLPTPEERKPECVSCGNVLTSAHNVEYRRCDEHAPNFDSFFEESLYSLWDEGPSYSVFVPGMVQKIKQLEMLIDNLQEQILELSKGEQ